MNFTKTLLFSTSIAAATLFTGCGKNGGGINVFSIDDDKQLGLQTKQMIEADPAQYPILNRNSYASAYTYLTAMRDDILASGQVTYRTEFPWEINIIQDDNTLNAFATPGGYIYIYTGLIKYLDHKSSLAGVLGHEMGHADKRHSTNQLTKQYGVQTLLDVVLGKNQGLLTQIGSELITLKFSRTDESQADECSVNYLCPTKYRADGAADFFQKIIDMGSSNPPEFLSTHPNPDNRVQAIRERAIDKGCTSTIASSEDDAGYAQFKASLP